MTEHFKGRIKRFEIGSEPNAKPKGLGEKFTEGFPSNSNPELYGEVFGETAEVIKSKNPEAEIIFGNVALFDPEFIGKGLEKAKEYEEKLIKEGKIKPDQHLVDYIGFHPYRKNPEAPSSAVKDGIGQLSKEQDEAARKKYGYNSYDDQIGIYEKIVEKHYPNAKLINTEVGWHTEAPDEHSSVPDEKTQAEYNLKATAIDASHGISTNSFELFEKDVGERYSLINKEGKPRKGLKDLESFNKYLESLQKQGEEKETPEEWVETHKEQFKEKTYSIWREIYKEVFPERTFNIKFLSPEAFSKYCHDKKLPLPPGEKAEDTFFNRFKEGNVMNYPINKKVILEWLRLRVEFGREREEQKTNDEIAEKLIINLGAHEIRHDLHPHRRPEEKLIEPITLESISGYEELQKEFKKISKELQQKGMSSELIPEERDCKIVDETAGNLWERGIKDIDLISKIVRNGNGSNIGEIHNLLKNEKLTTPDLLEKVKEVMGVTEKREVSKEDETKGKETETLERIKEEIKMLQEKTSEEQEKTEEEITKEERKELIKEVIVLGLPNKFKELVGDNSDEAWGKRKELAEKDPVNTAASLAGTNSEKGRVWLDENKDSQKMWWGISRGLIGDDSKKAWEIREHLKVDEKVDRTRGERLADIKKTLGLQKSETLFNLRGKAKQLLGWYEPGDIVISTTGLDSEKAWKLREEMEDIAPAEVLISLAGVDSERAQKLREKYAGDKKLEWALRKSLANVEIEEEKRQEQKQESRKISPEEEVFPVKEMSPEDFKEMIDQIPALKEMLREREERLKLLMESDVKIEGAEREIENLTVEIAELKEEISNRESLL